MLEFCFIVSICHCIEFFGICCKSIFTVKRTSFPTADGHLRKSGIQMESQGVTEFFCSLCIAVIVVSAPSTIYFKDSSGSALVSDFSIGTFGHAIVIKGNYGIVFFHINLAGFYNGVWFCKLIPCGNDGF